MDAVLFVISQNIHRRHLTVQQRAALALTLLDEERKRAKERELAGAFKGGAATKLRHSRGLKQSPRPKKHDRATDRVAKAVGTSRNSVEYAIVIDKKGSPALKRAVAAGEVSLSRGAREVPVNTAPGPV